MMALWLYEKCSARDGYFQTYKHGVGLAADIVESLWTIHPVFRTMRQFDRDGTALSEFLEERRLAVKSSESSFACLTQVQRLPKTDYFRPSR